ncbi:glycosyltransferase family 39 protein [Lentimicrobium sp.]|uniref:ArnT family glycosyltransferase n=1 Tax=Lentimicrobium sp. TaxID=2034841 RepID=UPI002C1C60A2|nr:glycosyltransferase family 39 protein [Lentimicrobium sp.]HRW69978.1 glycosyltransferase family 39 protein [Lentimicrobium sp.]
MSPNVKVPVRLPIPLALSFVLFVLLMFSSFVKPYGFFIDEVYFLSCARRPAWGYIDQPPLSLALLAAVQWLFGENTFAVRLLPALSMAATVFVTGLITRRLGGGPFSLLLACLGVMVMPVFLIFGSFYSMNAFEPLIWTGVVYFVVKMVQDNDPLNWLAIGILSGIGLQNKHTFVLYGFALVIGILISGRRRLLFNRWILWGGLAAFVILLPNLIWQVANGFPSLELYRNSFTGKNIEKSPLQILTEQIIFVNPATFPLWFAGVIALIFRKGRDFRLMLYAYLFLMAVMIAGQSSRPDRIASIYTFFMAFGAVAMEHTLKKAWQRGVQVSLTVVMLAGGVLLAPVFAPLLPPDRLKAHIAWLGLKMDIEEGKKGEPIPQWLADRLGWRELAVEVAGVYHALPPAERQHAVIISSNYGHAGALELYGPELGLPAVYATHNAFHTWGPPPDSVKTYIAVAVNIEKVKSMFDSVEKAAVVFCPDCTRPQREMPVYVLRGPKFSVEKEWKGFRIYG